MARFERAELLARLGRLQEAAAWYNTTVYYPPDWIMLAQNYARRAEVYERMGQNDRAIEDYSRFIRLWKDCDPELRPMVEQARSHLARLQCRGIILETVLVCVKAAPTSIHLTMPIISLHTNGLSGHDDRLVEREWVLFVKREPQQRVKRLAFCTPNVFW